MKIATTAVAAALGALFALPAFAQDSADYVSRNARQALHNCIVDGK